MQISGMIVTIICLYVFYKQLNFKDLYVTISEYRWEYLLYGVLSLFLGYLFRVFRWSISLNASGSPVSFQDCLSPFLASIALNNILPLRLGDVIRVLIFPSSMGIPKATATSSLIIERLLDLMTLLICLSCGLYIIQYVEIPSELKFFAVSSSIFGISMLIFGILFSKQLAKICLHYSLNDRYYHILTRALELLSNLLSSFSSMSRPYELFKMLILSIIVWFFEAGLFYFSLLGANIDGTFLAALLIMSISTLSTLIPSSPGYVGSFHIAAFTALSLMGLPSAQAGGYSIVVHLLLWIPTTFAGMFAILLSPSLFSTAKKHVYTIKKGNWK